MTVYSFLLPDSPGSWANKSNKPSYFNSPNGLKRDEWSQNGFGVIQRDMTLFMYPDSQKQIKTNK